MPNRAFSPLSSEYQLLSGAPVRERPSCRMQEVSVRIHIVGGGPAGLYFSILMKKADPQHEIVVFERNRADDTFGFGVVFSDATLGNIAAADQETYDAITREFAHWDDIDIYYQQQVLNSTGHGFCGLSRHLLLKLLQERAASLKVELRFEHEVQSLEALRAADLLVIADGVNSVFREQLKEHFRPSVDWRSNRFIWLGTTLPLKAFSFFFKETSAGLWRVHAYRYNEQHSTFIVECTEQTWRRAGMDSASEDESITFLSALFADELQGHPLLKNRSIWRAFPTIKNGSWVHENMVLMGDAAHTAHFSIGSGTKLALEDAIALAAELKQHASVREALTAYDGNHRPSVEATQRAAQVSLTWFEETERYYGKLEPLQFAFSLLTRSLRITHDNLKMRDPRFVETLDTWVCEKAAQQVGRPIEPASVLNPTTGKKEKRLPPPMFTPFKLRELTLSNRVVLSPMCMYSAEDGMPNDWHLVHLGSRAVGGAGLILTEMTDVSREGRITPGCTGLYRDEHVAGWKRIVEFVHAQKGVAIGVQLAHAGRKGSTRRMWEGIDQPLEHGNWELMAPSPVPYLPVNQVPRAMNRADMDRVKADFVASAERAEAAGFDLLELHFAHGYLLSTFLTPLANRRTDEYGGSLENRMRYPLEVFDAVRAVWPAHKPMSVRISATDWAPGGFTGDDAVALARVLKAHGCDVVDVSAGQTVAEAKPVYGRLFQTPFSERVRLEADVPTMTVGNISSYADVNSIVAAGRADLCAIARAHLFDPYWTRHAAQEQGWPLRWPDPYVSVSRYTPRFK